MASDIPMYLGGDHSTRRLRGEFIPNKRKRSRHDCADHLHILEVHPEVVEGQLWVCICGRRWRLVAKRELGSPPPSGHSTEGVTITGPAGSQYWRPFLMRFVGRIGA